MAAYWQDLTELVQSLGRVLAGPLEIMLAWLLLIVWIAWWLWGVNWTKLWPTLREGAWVPLLLAAIAGALAWSQITPSSRTVLNFMTIGNFWWQLGLVLMLLGIALLCGWVQGLLHWTPEEIDLDPPEHAHVDAGHGHH